MTEAFFVSVGDGVYQATPCGHGPWSDRQEHGGPVSALLTRAMEYLAPDGGHLARVAVDFLQPVPVGTVQVDARVVKRGRSASLLGATLSVGGRTVATADAWWRRTTPGLVPAVPLDGPVLPPPDTLLDAEPATDLARYVHRGYVASMRWRYAGGRLEEPGPTTVWARPRIPLVAGEAGASPTQLAMLLADCASGASAALDFRTHVFSNLDLAVNLLRPPADGWLSLQATTAIDEAGGGLCTAVLGDENGPLGTTTQALFVAPRPS